MSSELHELFHADQADRANHPDYGTPEYRLLRERDTERRKRLEGIIESGGLKEPEDYYHAAWILNHGESVEEIWQAHILAKKAAEFGFRRARWLAAATYDRWLMYQGKPQKYGTQIVPDGKRQRVWDVESATTDDERAEWDVPSLAEMERRAEEVTRNEPMPPMETAPEWLRGALLRWRTEEEGGHNRS
ncbi:MAG TPA: hypothetical protein VN256_24795 [Pyrinomonadaceae bacterium]|nr:hypothetical protein [Pyrinomonadaceae bacterium]